MKQNGEVRDLSRPLVPDVPLEIITERSGRDALDLIRHDAAHVLATAVLELYPGVKISIGPPIEQGFYYDFDFPDGVSLSDGDFDRIEARMREHVQADEPFIREDVPVSEALDRFRAEGQDYKVELIEDLVCDQGVETVSLYTNGPFTDLCRGPHAPSTKRIGAFRLQSVAGAYWRGDASRQMLTRVYGTAFFKAKDLEDHLKLLEEARARDHRKLGAELKLFQFSDLSPGSPFWQPNGMAIWNELTALWREENTRRSRSRRSSSVSMYARARPSAAARPRTSAIACSAARGIGPHVPAFRYASSEKTGNSARSDVASTAADSTAARVPRDPPNVTNLHRSRTNIATIGRAPRLLA